MKIRTVYYSSRFKVQFQALPLKIKRKAFKAEALFKVNAFHPSLRLHKLKGKLAGAWSLSVDRAHRIIFKPLKDGDVFFHSIGLHAIYED